MPVHLQHRVGKTGAAGSPGAAARDRQRYVERAGAVDIISAERVGEIAGSLAVCGNLGATPAARSAFWDQAAALERPGCRLQHSIIAELPHEVSSAGRLQILQSFCSDTLDAKSLPHWGVIHRPDAHNDPRNYHAHILYHARPGRLTAGTWDFTSDAGGAHRAGQYPWGREKPAKRIARLEAQLTREPEPAQALRYLELKAQAEAHAEMRRSRSPERRGGMRGKSRRRYPWGQEAPLARRQRLEAQLLPALKPRRRTRYARDLAQVTEYLAAPDEPVTAPTVNDRSWIRYLRAAWCLACNTVLAAEGHAKRYDPGGYRHLGIAAEPTKHLSTKAAALEAQGRVTVAGRQNTERVFRNRLADGDSEESIRLDAARTVAGRRLAWAIKEAADAVRASHAKRLAYWNGEAAAAREAQRAIQERADRPQPAIQVHHLTAEALRSGLLVRSALGNEPQRSAPPRVVASPMSTEGIAELLRSRMAPGAMAHAVAPPSVAVPVAAAPVIRSAPAQPAEPAPQRNSKKPAFVVSPDMEPWVRRNWRTKLCALSPEMLEQHRLANEALLAEPDLYPLRRRGIEAGTELIKEMRLLNETAPARRAIRIEKFEAKWAFRALMTANDDVAIAVEEFAESVGPIKAGILALRHASPNRQEKEMTSLVAAYRQAIATDPAAKASYTRLDQVLSRLEEKSVQFRGAVLAAGGLTPCRADHLQMKLDQATRRMLWIPPSRATECTPLDRFAQALAPWALDPGCKDNRPPLSAEARAASMQRAQQRAQAKSLQQLRLKRQAEPLLPAAIVNAAATPYRPRQREAR